MSYRLHVDGSFTLDHPLPPSHISILREFAKRRHEGLLGRGYVNGGYPYCQWVPSDDGERIRYTDEEESGYDCEHWLKRIIDDFLAPWGYTLNGRVTWGGEEPGDLGVIEVKNNEVRWADAIITYPDLFPDE
jgi:hypothetical protein